MQDFGSRTLKIADAGVLPRQGPVGPRPDDTNVLPFLRAENSNEPFHRGRWPAPAEGRGRMSSTFAVLLVGSLALHGAVLAALIRDPEPMPSLGIPSISVEIVLGGDAPAGVDARPVPAEAEAPVPDRVEEARPAQMAADKPTRTVEPDPEPVRTEQTRDSLLDRDPGPEDVTSTEARDAPRTSDPPERVAVLDRSHAMREAPPPADAVQEMPIASPPRRSAPETHSGEAKPARAKPAAGPKREAAPRPQPASAASSGVGRGSSSADPSYAARVAAHLARHKRFPSEARSQANSGSATVQFSIDGAGHVTSVRLVRGTGVAVLDQEAQAMVRRASPVPPPPGRQATSFTLPISFQVR